MATNAMEIRLARLEGVYEQIDKRLSALEVRLDAGITQVNQRIDDRVGGLDRKIDALSWRLVALILANWITLMLVIVGGWLLRP